MTVDTLQLDRLSVEIVISSSQSELILLGRSLLDFHLSEANDGREGLNRSALGILQFSYQCITVRSFCTPELHLVGCIERSLQNYLSLGIQFSYERSRSCNAFHQVIVVGIETVGIERILQGITLDGLLRKILQLGSDVQGGMAVGFIQVRNSLDVSYLNLWFSNQSHGAEDTRQAEHILTLQERTV